MASPLASMSGLYGPKTLSVTGDRDNIFIDTFLSPLLR